MTLVGFPTKDFPAPLPFLINLPARWMGAHIPGALLAAYRPAQTAGSSLDPTVLVTWQRTHPDTSVRKIADQATKHLFKTEPASEVLLQEIATSDSFEAALSLVEERSAFETAIRHAFLFVLGPSVGDVRDFYIIEGTYPAGDDEIHEEVKACLLSFALATPKKETEES